MEYGNFYIEEPLGNNQFSFNERKTKSIFVPKLIKASFNDIEYGVFPNFIEFEDGKEVICRGLKNLYEIVEEKFKDKKIYLFDNHNHAFYFWCRELREGNLKAGNKLIHVDQHKDMREPYSYEVDIHNIDDVVRYTNYVLNVGNFIKPALYHGIFSQVEIIDSSYSLNNSIPKDDFYLDIDLDFFSPDMDYIDFNLKVEKIKSYIEKSKVITIATSPYFIEQKRAVEAMYALFL